MSKSKGKAKGKGKGKGKGAKKVVAKTQPVAPSKTVKVAKVVEPKNFEFYAITRTKCEVTALNRADAFQKMEAGDYTKTDVVHSETLNTTLRVAPKPVEESE